MTRCGLETRLSGLGLMEGDLDRLVESTRWNRTVALPIPLGPDDLRGMLEKLL
ncbi:MAG: hypothetical protein IIC23_13235, partial [Chloroflexi bacterium]|nr:hypothetical protein [Chloroflexota bacterium]